MGPDPENAEGDGDDASDEGAFPLHIVLAVGIVSCLLIAVIFLVLLARRDNDDGNDNDNGDDDGNAAEFVARMEQYFGDADGDGGTNTDTSDVGERRSSFTNPVYVVRIVLAVDLCVLCALPVCLYVRVRVRVHVYVVRVRVGRWVGGSVMGS